MPILVGWVFMRFALVVFIVIRFLVAQQLYMSSCFFFLSISQVSYINQREFKPLNQTWPKQIKPNSTLNKTLSKGVKMSKSAAQLCLFTFIWFAPKIVFALCC